MPCPVPERAPGPGEPWAARRRLVEAPRLVDALRLVEAPRKRRDRLPRTPPRLRRRPEASAMQRASGSMVGLRLPEEPCMRLWKM